MIKKICLKPRHQNLQSLYLINHYRDIQLAQHFVKLIKMFKLKEEEQQILN